MYISIMYIYMCAIDIICIYLQQGEKGQSIGGHGKERSPTKG